MEKTIILTALLSSSLIFSQVIIGGQVSDISDKTSVLLEFASDNNKGIIVPYVSQLPLDATVGTILLDATDPTAAKMKYYTGNSTNPWFDLSIEEANVTSDLAVQSNTVEDSNAKVIIGASETVVNSGALVLESKTKAMVLPVVTDVQNIDTPSPGMMVYVKGTVGQKRLAVYNGKYWTFWKP